MLCGIDDNCEVFIAHKLSTKIMLDIVGFFRRLFFFFCQINLKRARILVKSHVSFDKVPG